MTFAADMEGAIVEQAHANNIRPGRNHPRVLVLHTPEEDADEREGTPHYFSRDLLLENPPRRASTHYYISGGLDTPGDGDLYQMVPESQGAIANGVLGKPYPRDTDQTISLNLQSLSVELEGRAHTIHETMKRDNPQWETTVKWIESRSAKYDIPLDTQHVIGHKDVSAERSDPGQLNIDQLVRDARALREEDEMKPYLVQERNSSYIWITDNVTRTHLRDMAHAQALGIDTQVKVVPEGTLESIPRVDKPD